MEFQFRTNWASFSTYAGGVIGQTLAMEGVFAFLAESVFLGVFLAGRNPVSARVHWRSALLLFAGSERPHSADRRAGVALADDALGMGRGAKLWEAEIRRLRATFLAALGRSEAEVATELERALAVARRQRARAFEARILERLEERSLRHDRAV